MTAPNTAFKRHVEIVQNDEEYSQLMSKAAKLTASYSWLAGSASVNVEMSFLEEEKMSSQKTCIAVLASSQKTTVVVDLNELTPTQAVRDAIISGDFEQQYGQTFVGGWVTGSTYVGNLQVTLSSKQTRKELRLAVAAHFSGFGLDVGAEYNQSDVDLARSQHYEMTAHEYGRGMPQDHQYGTLTDPQMLHAACEAALSAAGDTTKISAILFRYTAVPKLAALLAAAKKAVRATIALLDREMIDRIIAETNRLRFVSAEIDSFRAAADGALDAGVSKKVNTLIADVVTTNGYIRTVLKRLLFDSDSLPKEDEWVKIVVASDYANRLKLLRYEQNSIVPIEQRLAPGINLQVRCASPTCVSPTAMRRVGFGKFNMAALQNALVCEACRQLTPPVESSQTVELLQLATCCYSVSEFNYFGPNAPVDSGSALGLDKTFTVSQRRLAMSQQSQNILLVEASPLPTAVAEASAVFRTADSVLTGGSDDELSNSKGALDEAADLDDFSKEQARIEAFIAEAPTLVGSDQFDALEDVVDGFKLIPPMPKSAAGEGADVGQLQLDQDELKRLREIISKKVSDSGDTIKVAGVVGVIGFQNVGKSYLISNVFGIRGCTHRAMLADDNMVPKTEGLHAYLALEKRTKRLLLILDIPGYQAQNDLAAWQRKVDQLEQDEKEGPLPSAKAAQLAQYKRRMTDMRMRQEYYRRILTLCCGTSSMLLFVSTELNSQNSGFSAAFQNVLNTSLTQWRKPRMLILANLIANQITLDHMREALWRLIHNGEASGLSYVSGMLDERIVDGHFSVLVSTLNDSFYQQTDGGSQLRLIPIPNMTPDTTQSAASALRSAVVPQSYAVHLRLSAEAAFDHRRYQAVAADVRAGCGPAQSAKQQIELATNAG